MPLCLALVAAVGLVLAAASPASAADVETRVVDRGGHSGRAWEMVFTAAPGERNAVTTTEIDDYTLRITDAANPVTAGSRCRSIGAHTVECSTSGLPYSPSLSGYLYTARVIAGDRDDTVRSAGEWGPLLVADGGTGSDFIEGALKRGDDLDGGGGGTDRLFGRGNSDTLTDGDDPAAVDADVLDGGDDAGEQDTVSYARRTAPLTIDLADADTDGEQGEGDTLTSVESAVGGAGDDTLDGTPGPNWLRGGAGDDHLDGHGAGDTLEGQAGDDLLHGHTGDDALHGGTGADRLRGDSGSDVFRAPTRADTISCGTGASDTVSSPGAGVRIPTTCDTVSAEFDEAGHLTRTDEGTAVNLDPIPVARTRRTETFSVGCPKPAMNDGLCASDAKQVIRLRSAGGRLLGTGSLNRTRYRREAARERGRVNRITVRLTATGRRLLGRRSGYVATVSLRTDDFDAVVWRARLKAR